MVQSTEDLRPGFSNPVHHAQAAFRAILDAMSRPGTCHALDLDLTPPALLNEAAAAVCLTLLDFDTRIWADFPPASDTGRWLVFHTHAPFDRPENAGFALVTDPDKMPDLKSFPMGTAQQPEASALVIVQARALEGGKKIGLSGPGIDGRTLFSPQGLCDAFWQQRREMADYFPLGLDFIFTSGSVLAALPRTTRTDT